jgi:hypothetical protein
MTQNEKPLYIIRFGDGTFYNEKTSWKGVTNRKDATKLTHSDATRINNKLNQPRIQMQGTVIPAEKPNTTPY